MLYYLFFIGYFCIFTSELQRHKTLNLWILYILRAAFLEASGLDVQRCERRRRKKKNTYFGLDTSHVVGAFYAFKHDAYTIATEVDVEYCCFC